MTEPILTTYEGLKKDLVVVDESKTEEQRRSELVESLKQGITRCVLGEPLMFKLYPERPSGKSTVQNLYILDASKNHLASLYVEIDENKKKVTSFEKYYELVQNQKLKGIGLISFASGLFFQALIDRGVTQVTGQIQAYNRSSIASRLKTEDLIKGGYFYTAVSSQKDTKGYHQVVSYIDPTLPRLSQPILLAEAQLNQIFSAPEFAVY